jgi:hypothetical protein
MFDRNCILVEWADVYDSPPRETVKSRFWRQCFHHPDVDPGETMTCWSGWDRNLVPLGDGFDERIG